MSASVDGFLEAFPEFNSGDRARLETGLARVEARVDPDFLPNRTEVVYLELADSLSAGINGRNARKERGKTGNTQYRAKLDELQAIYALGNRVI